MGDVSEQQAATDQRVDPAEYSEDYYLHDCEGFDVFGESRGSRLSPRLTRALELAATEPGQRVLDIGCGRGEITLHGALRGAFALGVDYSAAAVALAGRTVAGQTDRRVRAGVARMDATHLGLPAATFDTVLMLDFVEHLYPHELERAFDEALRVLRPGGRLIIHTSPNRVFEHVIYPRYVRHVHRLALKLARRLGVQDRLLNPLMLPTGPTVPHSDFDHRLHVNEQTAADLRAMLKRRGFRAINVSFWEPPARRFFTSGRETIEVHVLDFIRYLRPFSRYWPLSGLFSNHIWIVASRPTDAR